jgi:hypothetical protein
MMKTRDVAATLVTAAVTMIAAVAMFWPVVVGAEGEPASMQIVQPSIAIAGCQFTIESAQFTPDRADASTVVLRAANPSRTASQATVYLLVYGTQPESEMSRSGPVATLLWSHECNASLVAGDAQTVRVPIHTALPAGQSLMISMADALPGAGQRR